MKIKGTIRRINGKSSLDENGLWPKNKPAARQKTSQTG